MFQLNSILAKGLENPLLNSVLMAYTGGKYVALHHLFYGCYVLTLEIFNWLISFTLTLRECRVLVSALDETNKNKIGFKHKLEQIFPS